MVAKSSFFIIQRESLIQRLGILYTIFLLCSLKITEWIIDKIVYSDVYNKAGFCFFDSSQYFAHQQKELVNLSVSCKGYDFIHKDLTIIGMITTMDKSNYF